MSCSKQFKHCKALIRNFNTLITDLGTIATSSKAHQLQYSNVTCRYNSQDSKSKASFSEKLQQGPNLQHFIANSGKVNDSDVYEDVGEFIPYLEEDVYSGHGRKGKIAHNS